MSVLKNEEFSYICLQKSVDFIKKQVPFAPKLLIICGSGLGGLTDILKNPISLSYEDIPDFPASSVEGHAGKLIFGTLLGVKVACMKGRFHYYEGYSLQKITMPIRIMKLIGVESLLITNAAGGINENYKAGDIMVIKDHINFLALGGQHPLRGPNDVFFGPRFLPMNRAYDKDLILIARKVAEEIGLLDCYHEGVYGLCAGPSYETVAEVKALKLLGIDATGMSTIPEVLVAKHCGMTVFGFSFITNACVDSYDNQEEPNHSNVLDVVDSRMEKIKEFVMKIIEKSRDRFLDA